MNNHSKMRRNYSQDVEDWNFQKVLSVLEAELYSIYVSLTGSTTRSIKLSQKLDINLLNG